MQALHIIEPVDGSQHALSDRLNVGVLRDVAFAAGGGAGLASTVTVDAALISGLKLPPNYAVQVTPNKDAIAYVTGKSATGFTVTIYPRLAANTLAAGTMDIWIAG